MLLVVITSTIDCLERLVSEMACYVSSGTLNPTHSLTHLSIACGLRRFLHAPVSNKVKVILIVRIWTPCAVVCKRLSQQCANEFQYYSEVQALRFPGHQRSWVSD